MLNINEYKNLVSQYYFIGYKWKGILNTCILQSYKPYIKLNKTGSNILESIEVLVEYPYCKIVNLTVYILPLHDLSTYNSSFPEHNIGMLNYINNIENKKKITKYNIKIIENDKIFTITDNKYNILKLNTLISSVEGYLPIDISVKYLITNILEIT